MFPSEGDSSRAGALTPDSIRKLELRVARIEAHLGLNEPMDSEGLPRTIPHYGQDEGLQLKIGELGLAWGGSIVFLLGLVFLMTYISSQGYGWLATVMGFGAASGLYALAQAWKDRVSHFSNALLIICLLLLYYTTARLHFFAPAPIISNIGIAVILLILVSALLTIMALRRDSQALAWMSLFLGLVTALLGDATNITLSIILAVSLAAVWLAIQRRWRNLVIAAVALVYLAHLIWILGNPIAGHPLGAISDHQVSLVYLYLYAASFFIATLSWTKEASTDSRLLALISMNCLGFSILTLTSALAFFAENFAPVFLGLAVFLLLCSIVQWLRTNHHLCPSVYACFGYMALSVAVYGYSGTPQAFVWLAIQSLLVVSMALWFRSRILVVVNSLIYFVILAAYIIIHSSSNLANFSFAFVALASARIINWQKERLTLRTEIMRNLYLMIAFLMVLFALRQSLPGNYVALSWTAAAVGYFVLSLVLQNIKYRWMSLFTMLATVLHLFLVDLGRLDPTFRVVAFLALGVMALCISLFHTKLRRILGNKEGDDVNHVPTNNF